PPSTLFPYTTLFRSVPAESVNLRPDTTDNCLGCRQRDKRVRPASKDSWLERKLQQSERFLNQQISLGSVHRFRKGVYEAQGRAQDRKSTRLNSSHVA